MWYGVPTHFWKIMSISQYSQYSHLLTSPSQKVTIIDIRPLGRASHVPIVLIMIIIYNPHNVIILYWGLYVSWHNVYAVIYKQDNLGWLTTQGSNHFTNAGAGIRVDDPRLCAFAGGSNTLRGRDSIQFFLIKIVFNHSNTCFSLHISSSIPEKVLLKVLKKGESSHCWSNHHCWWLNHLFVWSLNPIFHGVSSCFIPILVKSSPFFLVKSHLSNCRFPAFWRKPLCRGSWGTTGARGLCGRWPCGRRTRCSWCSRDLEINMMRGHGHYGCEYYTSTSIYYGKMM